MAPLRDLYAVLDRVEALVSLYRSLTTVGRPRQPLSDLLRGSLILGLSGLDAFVHASLVRAAARAEHDGLLGPTATAWVVRDTALAGLPAGAARRTAVRALFERKLGKTTLQRPAAIEAGLRHVSAPVPWAEAAVRVTTPEDPVDAATVVTRLDSLVDRRDRIAHHGDRAGHGLRAIRADYVDEQAWLVLGVGEAIARTIADTLA